MSEVSVSREIAADLFDFQVDTLIIGAGACGMVAALAAHEAGREVLILDRDPLPSGSTALSAGLIPAAGTRFQRAAGVDDAPALFCRRYPEQGPWRERSCFWCRLWPRAPARRLEWLADRFGLPFSLVADFDYPGHSRRRMHGLPSRSGRGVGRSPA